MPDGGHLTNTEHKGVMSLSVRGWASARGRAGRGLDAEEAVGEDGAGALTGAVGAGVSVLLGVRDA